MLGIRSRTRRTLRQIKNRIRTGYFSGAHRTLVQPSHGWRTLDLGELWAYRELFWVLALRDIKVRYKQTVLGCAWAIIQPLMGMFVFSIIFGHWVKVPSEGYPYPIFVYAALLPWTFFSNALSESANSVVSSTNLITKVYFPRLIIPLASIGSVLVDFLISSGVMLFLMLYYHVDWHLHLLALPFLILAVAFAALGIGTLLSALIVAYRDFRYVVPFMIQLLMFATPVVFPVTLVPPHWRWALYLNPMAGIVDGFRSAFLGKPFNRDILMLSFCASVILFLIGVAYFERVERRFADVI